jgi:hypothetical protein
MLLVTSGCQAGSGAKLRSVALRGAQVKVGEHSLASGEQSSRFYSGFGDQWNCELSYGFSCRHDGGFRPAQRVDKGLTRYAQFSAEIPDVGFKVAHS